MDVTGPKREKTRATDATTDVVTATTLTSRKMCDGSGTYKPLMNMREALEASKDAGK